MGTLWHGGKIRTLINETDVEEAVYVRNGKVINVGDYDVLRRDFQETISEEINLQGATMYPGFVDSHLHMIGHGEKLLKLDVSEVSSIQELKSVLGSALESVSEGEWLLAEGFNENLYQEHTVPDRYILDEVSINHPIMITRVCRHALVTNSLGLQLAEVNGQTIDPPGGLVERDDKGIPTGYMHDQAQELIKNLIPEEGFNYIEKALRTSLNDLFRNGYTGGHSEDLNYYGDATQTLETFYRVIDGEKTKFRANLLVHHEVADEIIEQSEDRLSHPYVELGSIKIFTDGALGGRTALLSEAYSDDPSTNGMAIHTKEGLELIVKHARELKMPVAIHTIGDLSLEYAIDALEKYPVLLGKRDRLIHLQVTRKELLTRLQELPVVLDIQPRFVASDFPWVEERLGQKRLEDAFAWKTLLNHHLICAGGSDAPIEPINPLLGLHAAVTRRKPYENHKGYSEKEKLSLFEALQLFTKGSAQAIGREEERGIIAPGYTADFTVLTEDLFELSPDEWLNVTVEKTIVDNSVMYEK
ncbi:amidohydrolase [Salipaludibacillus sp. CF4.18]|uniref:amidohydrolase n=1 Tax=Salipaludibacillus sp. CF4.18 TaxID=3373081 RepID=UPI003EE59941